MTLSAPSRGTGIVAVAAVVSDVDGSLVTDDKVLTQPAREAVADLRDRGIAFTIISSRPPRGLRRLIDDLQITKPFGAFNGGIIANPDLSAITTHVLDREAARRAVDMLEAQGVQAWVYAGQDWVLRNPDAPYVAHEEHTLGYRPKVVTDFGAEVDAAVKIVGVSADFDLLEKCEHVLADALAGQASVMRSQRYYLDITHASANKGAALSELSRLLAVPETEIAVIGDGRNDIAMFRRSGFAIAMGNATPDVQRAADAVTDSNRDEGFANAVTRLILNGDARSPSEAP